MTKKIFFDGSWIPKSLYCTKNHPFLKLRIFEILYYKLVLNLEWISATWLCNIWCFDQVMPKKVILGGSWIPKSVYCTKIHQIIKLRIFERFYSKPDFYVELISITFLWNIWGFDQVTPKKVIVGWSWILKSVYCIKIIKL